MKVLVLGHKGMLGHMVVKYFKDNNVEIFTTSKRWPSNQQYIKNFKGDYIVNCIGAIPQRTNEFDINWQLPIWLDLNSPCKVIHPGTDCEIDNDNYGISKNIAGNYIRNLSKQTKSIKTSIIGPELKGNASLMEWFLSQKKEVYGYTKAIWNGNTTLEWAKQCLNLMNSWDHSKYFFNEITIFSKRVSKYELLVSLNKIFEKNLDIIPKPLGKNKTLQGTIYTTDITSQLNQLKDYYYGH